MKRYPVTIPEIAIVAATRAMAGAGAGLLLSEFVPRDSRRAVGWTLLAVGAITTLPILLALTGGRDTDSSPDDSGYDSGAL